jgi:large subunit ribosomal protein L29
MKAQDFNKKTKEDLNHALKEKREKLFQLKFDLASGKIKNVREIRQVKKDIARILTFLKKQDK